MRAERYFPLRAAGFRSNPFRVLADADWADVAVLPPAVLDAFEHSTAHLQVLGSPGSGKTTTLLALAARAEAQGIRCAYEYLPEGQDLVSTNLSGLARFLLDEAQRLCRSELARLLGHAAEDRDRPGHHARNQPATRLRLVLSSHADLTAHARAAGLSLVTVRADTLTVEQYRAVLARRLAAVALPGRPHATLTEDAVGWLVATFGQDRRRAEWLLYEAFQALRAPDVVDAARLSELLASGSVFQSGDAAAEPAAPSVAAPEPEPPD